MNEDIDSLSWEDIAKLIDKKIRREVSSALDAGEDSWEKIGKSVEQKIRHEFAKVAETDDAASWNDIGKNIEGKVKKVARDWAEK